MQEIPLRHLLKTVTPARLANAAKATAGYLLSAATRRPVVWGEPFILTVEPTNVCNLKCPLCVTGNGSMLRPSGKMSFETFRSVIDAIGHRLFYLLLYQQGEPFINPDILEFVRYAKARRIFVTTSSNGHYLDQPTCAGIVASGLDSIIVSIDGATQESYEKYRVNGSLEKALNGIKRLTAEKRKQHSHSPAVYLQFIVMRHNEHELAAMRRLRRSLGADKLLIKTVQVETTGEAEEWLPGRKQWRRYRTNDGELQTKRTGKGPCPRPWTSALVNWNGEVVPCCFDKNSRHATGAMASGKDLNQIWKSNSYGDFRNRMLHERDGIDICRNCSQGLRLYL